MKLTTKIVIGVLGTAALVAASQEPVRESIETCICSLLRFLGLV